MQTLSGALIAGRRNRPTHSFQGEISSTQELRARFTLKSISATGTSRGAYSLSRLTGQEAQEFISYEAELFFGEELVGVYESSPNTLCSRPYFKSSIVETLFCQKASALLTIKHTAVDGKELPAFLYAHLARYVLFCTLANSECKYRTVYRTSDDAPFTMQFLDVPYSDDIKHKLIARNPRTKVTVMNPFFERGFVPVIRFDHQNIPFSSL